MPLTQIRSSQIDSSAQYIGFKNRIINGDMRIDQRNAGSAITGNAAYPVDRFATRMVLTTAVASFQRNSDAPNTSFSNSLRITATTGGSMAATDVCSVYHIVEGYNAADLGFGTATPFQATISFWVKATVTGTYAVRIWNSGAARVYLATYTINASNTWEQKSITFTPDTSGTWDKTNGHGAAVEFVCATGSTGQTATTNSWFSYSGTNYFGANGAANALATTGNIFAITGVQLEKGSTATSFDYRPYGMELALCQRYYYKYDRGTTNGVYGFGYMPGADTGHISVGFPTVMRTTPSFTSSAANTFYVQWYGGNTSPTGISMQIASFTYASVSTSYASVGVAGTGVKLLDASGTSYLAFSAEL